VPLDTLEALAWGFWQRGFPDLSGETPLRQNGALRAALIGLREEETRKKALRDYPEGALQKLSTNTTGPGGVSSIKSSMNATYDPNLSKNCQQAVWQAQILAKGCVTWTASAGLFISGSNFVFNPSTGWVNVTANRGANSTELLAIGNKVNHIFGKPAHNLGTVVTEAGSEAQALEALHQAAADVVKAKNLGGVFEETVTIGTQTVTIRGYASGGTVSIGTAFVK
jgi:hypothetical protein